MRFMILRKADRDTEAGTMPGEELLVAMGRYNEELAEHGVLVTGTGLWPSSEGARVSFVGGKPVVTDGPFAETKELLAGFTMIDVASLDEAVAWAKRWPALDGGGNAKLELRRVYELEDFAPGAGIDVHKDLEQRLALQPSLMNPYVVFAGQCREAFEEYASCLGGHVEMVMTYGESPMGADFPAEMHDKVLHAQVRVGRWVLMGSDMASDRHTTPQGFSIQISIDELARAQAAFERLAEGGTIHMPFAPTFWAQRFGMLVDRFGIPWMINCGTQT